MESRIDSEIGDGSLKAKKRRRVANADSVSRMLSPSTTTADTTWYGVPGYTIQQFFICFEATVRQAEMYAPAG
jgi:hypothetical protein